MHEFETRQLPVERDAVAPDGSDVRVLLRLAGGSMAHFQLAPGTVSSAVMHRSVEEIWYFVSGEGEMWRRQGERQEVVPVHAGTCITLPLGTQFQLRANSGPAPLEAVAVTMPPWPGDGEAAIVTGPWRPTLPPDVSLGSDSA
jgi:mannose-6-phosphate isomerase-like protein (cupin superfamily)